MTPSPPIIAAGNLAKCHADPEGHGHVAMEHIALPVSSGEIFGTLGPSGVGKTLTPAMLEALPGIDGGPANIADLDPASRPAATKRTIRQAPGTGKQP